MSASDNPDDLPNEDANMKQPTDSHVSTEKLVCSNIGKGISQPDPSSVIDKKKAPVCKTTVLNTLTNNFVQSGVSKKSLNPAAAAFKPKMEPSSKQQKTKGAPNEKGENKKTVPPPPSKKGDYIKSSSTASMHQQGYIFPGKSLPAPAQMNRVPQQLLHPNVGHLGMMSTTGTISRPMYVTVHHPQHGYVMMPTDTSMMNMLLMNQPPGSLPSPSIIPNPLMQQYMIDPSNPMVLVPKGQQAHPIHVHQGVSGYPYSMGPLVNDYVSPYPMGLPNPGLSSLLLTGGDVQGQSRQQLLSVPGMGMPGPMNPAIIVPNTLTPNMDPLANHANAVAANQFILDQHTQRAVTGTGIIRPNIKANHETGRFATIPVLSGVPGTSAGFSAPTTECNKSGVSSTLSNVKKSVEANQNQNKFALSGVFKGTSQMLPTNSVVNVGNANFAAMREEKLHCVIIVGLPASGKTTVGRQLVQELSEENNRWEFFTGGDFIGENNSSKSSGFGDSCRGELSWSGEGASNGGKSKGSDRGASWDTTKIVLDALSAKIDTIKATNGSLKLCQGNKISGLLIDKNMKGIEDLYYLAALLHEKHVHLAGIVCFDSEDDTKLVSRLELNDNAANKEERKEEMKEKYRFYRVILNRIQECTKSSGLWKKIDATKLFDNLIRDLRIQVLGSYSIRHNVKKINSAGYGDKCCTMIDNYREYARIMGEIMWYMSGKGFKPNQFPGLVNFTPLTVAAWQEKRSKTKIKENCVARKKIEGTKYILFHNNCKLYLVPRHMHAVLQISADAWMGTSPLSSLGPFILDGEIAPLIEDPIKEKFFVYDVLFWAVGKTIHTDACKMMNWDDRQAHLSKELLSDDVRVPYKPGVNVVIVHQVSKPLTEVPALLKRGECSAEGLVFQSTTYTGDVFLWRPPHTLTVDLRLAKMVVSPLPSNGNTAVYEVDVFDSRVKRYLPYTRFGNLEIKMTKLSQKPPVEGSLVSCGIDPSQEDSELIKTPLSPSGITRKGNYTIVDGSWVFFCVRHDIIITSYRSAVNSLFDDGVVPEHLLLSWFRHEHLIPPSGSSLPPQTLPSATHNANASASSLAIRRGSQVINNAPCTSSTPQMHSCYEDPNNALVIVKSEKSNDAGKEYFQKDVTMLSESSNPTEGDTMRKGFGIALPEHNGDTNTPTDAASKIGTNADFTLLGHTGDTVHDPVGRLLSMISSGTVRCAGSADLGTNCSIDMHNNVNASSDLSMVGVSQGDLCNNDRRSDHVASINKSKDIAGDNKCVEVTRSQSPPKRKCTGCRNIVPSDNGRIDRDVSGPRGRPFYCFSCWAEVGYELCECGNFSKGRRSDEKNTFYCDRCWRMYETDANKGKV